MSGHFVFQAEDLISPDDIEAKDFVTTLRGYDQNEVKTYLARVAAAYRTALQDAQLADLRLEELQHGKSDLADTMRHAQLEIDDARSMRQAAAQDLEAAQELRDEAIRHKEEAESALVNAKSHRSHSETSIDPYENAATQVAAILRAADTTASELQRESVEVLEAARLESEKTIADAQAAKADMERSAREFAEQQQALADAASRKYETVVSALQGLQGQLQVVNSAIGAMPSIDSANE